MSNEYVVDISQPPLPPPLRTGNSFVLNVRENAIRLFKYNNYVREYMRQLKESRDESI